MINKKLISFINKALIFTLAIFILCSCSSSTNKEESNGNQNDVSADIENSAFVLPTNNSGQDIPVNQTNPLGLKLIDLGYIDAHTIMYKTESEIPNITTYKEMKEYASQLDYSIFPNGNYYYDRDVYDPESFRKPPVTFLLGPLQAPPSMKANSDFSQITGAYENLGDYYLLEYDPKVGKYKYAKTSSGWGDYELKDVNFDLYVSDFLLDLISPNLKCGDTLLFISDAEYDDKGRLSHLSNTYADYLITYYDNQVCDVSKSGSSVTRLFYSDEGLLEYSATMLEDKITNIYGYYYIQTYDEEIPNIEFSFQP